MKVRWEIVKLSLKSISLLSWIQNALAVHSLLVGKRDADNSQWTSREEMKKKIIKANINTADRRGNKHKARSASEVLLHYRNMGKSSHGFQKFLSYIFCFLVSGPGSSISPDFVWHKEMVLSLQFAWQIPVHEAKVRSPWHNLSRAVQHPQKGDGFVEGSQLYLL